MFTSAIYRVAHMAYRLDLTLDPADALRAVAVEQLDDAMAQLREPDDPVKAVHQARKDLKKVRSLLRLSMRGKHRRSVNAELRDIAAGLAGARDADVMVATIAALRERYAGQLPARVFTTVSRRFAREAAAAEVDPDVVARLEIQRGAAASLWRFKDPDVVAGLTRAYAHGRSELRGARRDPDVEILHEWRKRVKDLWYGLRLLEDAWPGPLQALAEEAHVLSDHLGDDHDLGVLLERFTQQEWPASVDAEVFVDLCQRRRTELQGQAFAVGARLYAEKPQAFGRRLSAYLAASAV